MAVPYSQNGSSLSQRLAAMFQQQSGRPADANDPTYAEFVKTAMPSMIADDHDRLLRSQGRWNTVNKLAFGAAALPFAAAALPALGIGGGASAASSAGLPASATSGVGFDATAAVPSTAARLGKIFGSSGFSTLANGALSLFGMHSQNKANDQSRRDVLAQQAKEIELAQQQLAAQTRDQDLNRADAKALNDAMQRLEAQKVALQQEQMQYERGISDKEQAYKDNYRSTIQGPAAARLRSILGF